MSFATAMTPDQIGYLYGLAGIVSALLFWKILIR